MPNEGHGDPAPRPLPPDLLQRDLRIMMFEGACFTLMQGFGENYLQPFALAMGLAAGLTGVFYMVPNLIGAVLQLVTPRGVRWLGSNQRWAVLCCALQAASFAPLAAAAWVGYMPTWAMFLLAALYWGAGMAAGPAWATWIGGVVPAERQARYFARRSRVMQISLLLALFAAGLILPRHTTSRAALPSLAVVFVLAGLARFLSSLLMSRQHETQPLSPGTRSIGTLEMLRRFRRTDDGRFLLFLLAMQAGVQMAGPFFTPFLIRKIELGYLPFTILTATQYVAKMAMAPLWGRVAHQWGPRRLFWIGAAGLVPLSSLWMVSWNYWWLLASQWIAGSMWCAYELAQVLMFFQAIHPDERMSLMTKYNVGNAAAGVAGTWIGARLLEGLPGDSTGYMAVFGCSCLVRAAALVIILRPPLARRGAARALTAHGAARPGA